MRNFSRKCIFCNLEIQPRFHNYWECQCKQFRLYTNDAYTLSGKSFIVEDYTEAGAFCIRRFHLHGVSDIVVITPPGPDKKGRPQGDPPDSSDSHQVTEKIFTDAEVLELVDKYKRLSVMV